MLIIKIPGPIPSKKNSRQCFVKNGRMMNIPSKNFTAWHKRASEHIKPYVKSMPYMYCPEIEIDFWLKSKRKKDLTNVAESVMDLLVDCGVFLDDNYRVCPNILLRFVDIDKDDPRAVVYIKAGLIHESK